MCARRIASVTPSTASSWPAWKQEGLTPNPEADRHTLIRRVTLDLTGLPPTPEEVEAFVRDESPKAYEALVDRLLARPSYGEHRARYWLDSVRYADTHGYHFDNYRSIWPYRDWVIHAFNANQPFDQFTLEQIAGDMLPKADAGPAHRHRLHPRRDEHQRGGHHPRGEPGDLRDGPRRDHVAGLAGADHGLRAVPRPQVRPDQHEGLLQHGGVLPEHDAAGHGQERHGLAADPAHAQGRRTRERYAALPAEIDAAKKAYDSHVEAAEPAFDDLAADPGARRSPHDRG